jgi:DNA-binding MarR family transcriptional regulator
MEQTLPDLVCACATVRRMARVITQLYGDHLSPTGLETTQISLLFILNKWPGSSQVALCGMLAFDKTTLSRNLTLLKKKGLVESAAVEHQREKGFYLTATGKEQLAAAKPRWNNAQAQLRSAMSGKEWKAMWKVFHTVTKVAQDSRIAREAKGGEM